MKSYYVTTPIYYVNGEPHLGSAYTTTIADTLCRFYRYHGRDSFFLTGTDEHGDKVAQAAASLGETPQQFTDRISNMFRSTWDSLGLKYSRFIRTTDPEHKRIVQSVLQKIYDKGDIYFGEYGGNYCVGCERFLTDKELVDGKCPDHQIAPKYVKEQNYFFRMSKYQDRLIEHITKTCPDFIRPERYKNEVLGLLREPLEDLCISRPKSRLTWGIDLPFDNNYVTYVWFDALLNYISGVDYPDGPNFKKYWTECEHLVGKDILKPHGVFWPTMLLAADVPLYRNLTVHGYWLTPTGKMSKSLGNVIDPLVIAKDYSMDVFRYFVLREMTFGLDGVFSIEALDNRYNADLANNLGNLVSRSLAMVHKYREGVVPKPEVEGPAEIELKQCAESMSKEVLDSVSSMELSWAVDRIWKLIDATNLYIDRTKPWVLAKEDKRSPEATAALNTSLYFQLEVIRLVGSVLTAFMPDTSTKILGFLGYQGTDLDKQQTNSACAKWGQLKVGAPVHRGETLFPRREKQMSETNTATSTTGTAAPQTPPTPADDRITYDDFAKVQLRVGQIIAAEKVEKSEKLLKLRVDLGATLGERQIVAGIAKHYKPEEIIGRKIVVVANLKPAKLMGIESQGMLLAGSDDLGNMQLLSPGDILAPGSVVK